jgi:hypothetical protein
MSPAYYLVSYALLKLAGTSTDMSLVLNIFNGLVFVVFQLLLFVFFSSLTSSRTIALFACLTVLLAPSIWLLSHQAHPMLLAMTLFVASLIVLDTILRDRASDSSARRRWLWFIAFCAAAMAMRLDIVLCFGAYLGLAVYRRAFSVASLWRGVAAVATAILLYLGIRYAILGYILPPSGGTLSYHLSTRFDPSRIPQNVVKDVVYWAMAVNPLIFAAFALGLLFQRIPRDLGVLLIAWIAPYTVFFLFQGMDFSRLAMPSIPIIALLAVDFVALQAGPRPLRALVGTLLAAQLTSVVLYYPLVGLYHFKIKIDDRPVGDVPIGFLPVDHYYRQRLIIRALTVAEGVTRERNKNVGIIGYAVMPYVYYLEGAPDVEAKGTETCKGLVYQKYTSASNEFLVVDLGANQEVENLLITFGQCLGGKGPVTHIVPHSREATLRLDQASR